MAKFKVKTAPDRNSTMAAVKNFEKNGSVTAVDPIKGVISQKRIETQKELEKMVEENPSISS